MPSLTQNPYPLGVRLYYALNSPMGESLLECLSLTYWNTIEQQLALISGSNYLLQLHVALLPFWLTLQYL